MGNYRILLLVFFRTGIFCFGTKADDLSDSTEYSVMAGLQKNCRMERIMEFTEKNCKISVIIPVYNAEKYIRETLNSIIDQSYKNWEIILVENGSEDKSPDIIREYEKKYPEIRMIKGPGKGPGPARNRGLKLAKGDYIVFVDADDYLPHTEIFRKYISIAEPTGADIVVSNYDSICEVNIINESKLE